MVKIVTSFHLVIYAILNNKQYESNAKIGTNVKNGNRMWSL